MKDPELIALSPQEPFRFGCNPAVSCFNQCCRDLNQALTPFDVLQLRAHLRLSWEDFLERFAVVHTGPATGLPVVSLRFEHAGAQRCPFVGEAGCSVYEARPTSCRLYPVARALQRSRKDGRISEHFALIKEPHCNGFDQGPVRSVSQWIDDQGARAGLAANDALMELIALKNRLRPGRLPPEHEQWAVLAFYDPERLEQQAADLVPGDLLPEPVQASPGDHLDARRLNWALGWIRNALFGTVH